MSKAGVLCMRRLDFFRSSIMIVCQLDLSVRGKGVSEKVWRLFITGQGVYNNCYNVECRDHGG